MTRKELESVCKCGADTVIANFEVSDILRSAIEKELSQRNGLECEPEQPEPDQPAKIEPLAFGAGIMEAG